MEEIKLPSGAKLRLSPAPFTAAKDLYQAVLSEMKGLEVNAKDEMDVNFFKNIVCSGFSSKEIEDKLWVCLERCLYDGSKITEETFEPIKAREDYFTVQFEVAKVNLMPFMKSLYAKYKEVFDGLLTELQE